MSNYLLTLPAELRLRIYNHVIPMVPLSEPRSQYIGLLHTSQQLRSEVLPELLAAMRRALHTHLDNPNSRRGYITSITFDEFHSLYELENLTIRILLEPKPDDFQADNCSQAQLTSDVLLAVLGYRFNILTIKIEGTERFGGQSNREAWMRMVVTDVIKHRDGLQPPIRGFRLDWREKSRKLAPVSTVGWRRWVRKFEGWEYREEENVGAQVGVVIVRRK
jgi:hypothetical protein